MFDLDGSFRGHSQVFSSVIPDFCGLCHLLKLSTATKADGLHLGSMGVSTQKPRGQMCEMTGSGITQVWAQVLGGSEQWLRTNNSLTIVNDEE